MTERRTIILADDGRHVSIGRHTEPSEVEIAAAGEALRTQGLGGWLASMEGSYYNRDDVVLVPLRELASAQCSFAEAEAAFRRLRAA